MIKEAIGKVVNGISLTETEMEKAMGEILSGGATPAQMLKGKEEGGPADLNSSLSP